LVVVTPLFASFRKRTTHHTPQHNTSPPPPETRRKQRQVEAQLKELGMEALDERLQSATQVPVNPPYRLARLISQITSSEGRAAVLVELSRPSPASPPSALAELAKRAVAAVRGSFVFLGGVKGGQEPLRHAVRFGSNENGV
jgi:hypothetical protein